MTYFKVSICTLYFFTSSSYDQEYKFPHPNIIDSNRFISSQREFALDYPMGGFKFAIMAKRENKNVNLMKNSTFYQYLNITLSHITTLTYSDSSQKTRINLPLGKCNDNYAANISNKEYHANQLKFALCPINFPNLLLSGKFNDEVFQYLRLRITGCDQNFLQNNFNPALTCIQNQTLIKEFVDSIVINWMFQQISVDVMDYQVPLSFYIHVNEFWYLNYMSKIESNLYFKETIFLSREGEIFSNINLNETFADFDYSEDLTAPRNNNEFLSSYVRLSPYFHTITRVYSTLLLKLGVFGGLVSLLISIFSIPATFYTLWTEKFSLISRICSYDFQFVLSRLLNPHASSKETGENLNIKELNEKVSEHTKPPDLSLIKASINYYDKPNLWKYLKRHWLSYIKKSNDPIENSLCMLHEKAINLLTSRLDTTYLIRNMIEFEFLKGLILNKDQLILFNSVCLPEIKLDDSQNNLFEISLQKNFTTEEILIAYENIKNSDEKISKKIIENMADIYKLAFLALQKKNIQLIRNQLVLPDKLIMHFSYMLLCSL